MDFADLGPHTVANLARRRQANIPERSDYDEAKMSTPIVVRLRRKRLMRLMRQRMQRMQRMQRRHGPTSQDCPGSWLIDRYSNKVT